ncbi:MAG TPA: C69 family dipeptidase [Ignavibacteriaceae bacterium]|nr:C69 family dipeptidase [Ignavibacteriaceae bacterium]
MRTKLFVTLFLLPFLLINNGNACTNFIVTKGASIDGSTMISYTADSYQFYGELYHFPAAVYPEGTMLDIYEWDTGKFLGQIKQALRTYNVIGNINEHQVVIGETTFGGRSELVNPKGILDYGSLIYIALQRSKTAREAIKIMTDLVAEYGYYSSGESFSIGDPNEAWILEMIGKGEGNKGAVWVAVRIPDGYVSGHANQARITTFPLNDPNNCIYSPDVISFAKERGYFSGKDSDFNFSDAYARLDYGAIRFCDGRVWSLFRRVNKDSEKYISYIKGENLNRMPLYIKPDNKLSVHDVMQLMRDHYQGTELDMTKGVAAGPYSMPYRWRPLTFQYNGEEYFNERPISTPQTGFSFISQSRSSLPNEVGGVLWFGVDDTYMTVYTPMYASMTKVPYNFSKGVGSLSHFTWDAAFWVFNFVSNYAYPKFSVVIGDIQQEQNRLEGKYLSQQERVEGTALALLKESKGKAVDYLTNYSIEMADITMSSWKKLGENLILKYMDGVKKNEFFKPVNIGYPDDFKKLIVDEAGDKIKMKKLPGENEREFALLVEKGNKDLSSKKYDEAKVSFAKASKLNPNDESVKSKLEKIDKILADIEKLHKSYLNE